ncbi:prepilin-type N-terminal cleavage/methylation domain-containing protein [Bowmanella pacifica]|uniref:Prepilin-type N-terminal cleavage/methylation domain-containing protein n=1 Tax=Bowmanella pacifica TaxID=502051 RepID=A0A917YT86_9ALTE|nr:prepilin-type N-terminal cleavage/methylation domain-containing protein [Bowmanella pacifica]GGO63605.1 hypothetical protein GCM10010982_01030 [Bowmanella pacifica]
MFLRKTNGFTMIELLVTLVLLGLVASVAMPGLDAWLSARKAASQRAELAGKLALMPLQANRQGRVLTVKHAEDLELSDAELEVLTPITVLASGYCKGGEVALLLGERRYQFSVLAPFCEVRQVANIK